MNKLAIACELSLNDWLATFPDIIPEAECSKKHEKWKKRLFNKMRDDHYHRLTTKTVKIMLVAAILLAILLTAFVFPSSRKSMMDNFDKFSMYKITRNNKNSVANEIRVGYIPEGFEFESSEVFSKHVTFKYKSSNGDYFTIFKYSSIIKVQFDTENFETEEIVIDGINYTYCQGNKGVNNLAWTKNDYIYKIDAPFEKDELVKIAKFVE